MIKIFTKLTATFAIAGLTLIGPPAFATGVDSKINASVGVDLGATNIIAQEEIDAETSVDVNLETTDEGEDEGGGEGFELLRSDLIAETEGGADGTVAVDPISVTSEEELEGYAQEILLSDEHAERVGVSEEEVTLTYKQEAQLFAFIPVLVDTTVTVRADGGVTVSYPWYSFLTQMEDASLSSSLESSVGAVISSEETDGQEVFTLEEQALVLSEVYAAMSSRLENEVNAEVEVQ